MTSVYVVSFKTSVLPAHKCPGMVQSDFLKPDYTVFSICYAQWIMVFFLQWVVRIKTSIHAMVERLSIFICTGQQRFLLKNQMRQTLISLSFHVIIK